MLRFILTLLLSLHLALLPLLPVAQASARLPAMVTAGLTAGLVTAADIKLPVDPTPVETTVYQLQTKLIAATVHAGVSTAIEGGDLGSKLKTGWTQATVMAVLSGVQQSIGDFGAAHNLPEGLTGSKLYIWAFQEQMLNKSRA